MPSITVTSTAPGAFSVAHGLGAVPTQVVPVPLSAGFMWFQQPTGWDSPYPYLVASDAGVAYQFQLSIATGTSTPSSGGVLPGNGSTVTLQSIVNFAKTLPECMPQLSVGGMSQQPALSIANHVMMDMLSPTMNWKWNRQLSTVFYTNSLQQDYAVPGVVNLGWIESAFLADINNTASPKPLYPVEVVRDLPATSWMWGRVGQVSWLPNNLLKYGTWQASTTFTQIMGSLANPGTPLSQIQDGNGNYWVLSNNTTQNVTTGTVQPTWPTSIAYPTPASPNQAATTVADGSAIWTAINPTGQGFRVNPLPPINGLYYEVHIIGQTRPARFVNMAQTLAPIPDDYADYFEHGFVAYCLFHSKDKATRIKFTDAHAMWIESMHEATAKSAREREESGFYPSEGILQGGYSGYAGPANPFFPGGS